MEEKIRQEVKQLLLEALCMSEEDFEEDMDYESTMEWSSKAHMQLMAALEKKYDITISPYDILDLNSYEKLVDYVLKEG